MKTVTAIFTSLLLILFLFQNFIHKTDEEKLLAAAQQFLNSLDQNQKKQATFSLEDEERFNWHFVPRERKGLPLKEMNEQQRKSAKALMQASLSQQGYQQANHVMELEGVLRELEGRGSDDTYRDPLNYSFTIFGTPQKDETWGWRLEGHHLSINFSSVDNRIVSASPTFFGANPAKVPSGPKKGWQILQPEEDLAYDLMRSLNSTQMQTAQIAKEAYPEIITSNDRKVNIGKPAGLHFADMNEKQQNKLMQLIQVYYDVYKAELAKEEMQQIKDQQDEIYFAWAGGLETGEGHYYRIHGPAFVIEFDNTQNNANHIHTVVRDLKNDFGEDVLKQHYDEAHRK